MRILLQDAGREFLHGETQAMVQRLANGGNEDVWAPAQWEVKGMLE